MMQTITGELMKNKAEIEDNNAKEEEEEEEEEEKVAASSNKIETPKIEDKKTFNQLFEAEIDEHEDFVEEKSEKNTNYEEMFAIQERFRTDLCGLKAKINLMKTENELNERYVDEVFTHIFSKLEEQSNTNLPKTAAAAEHEETETGSNHLSNEEYSEEWSTEEEEEEEEEGDEEEEEEEEEEGEEEGDEEEEEEEEDGCEFENKILRAEIQKLGGEVTELRIEIDVLEMEKIENEQEVKKVIDKYEMKVAKVKRGRDDERRKWEEEKNELAAKLSAATSSSELYKGLLHDIGF